MVARTSETSATGADWLAAKKRTTIVGARHGLVAGAAHVVSGGSTRIDDHETPASLSRVAASTAAAQSLGADSSGPQRMLTEAALGLGLALEVGLVVVGVGLGASVGVAVGAGAHATRSAIGIKTSSRRIIPLDVRAFPEVSPSDRLRQV